MWKPWKYEDRMKIANDWLTNLKNPELSEKQIKEKQFRSKFTELIARKKSRQEFVPLIENSN